MEQQGLNGWLSAANANGIFYNAALYCRLSKDDDTIGESSSIQSQRMICERFCADNHIRIHDFYIDDGYSGANFNRPGYQRLIKEIESGNINCVIVKDLSRLGRDYIQTGYYTEIFFVSKQVRFVAINDGIDSLKADNDIAPFKNILNDMYVKDISRKVKSAKRQRMLQGMFIAGQAPYGYKQNPNNPNQLVIDEEAAENVRLIFRLALDGMGANAIATELTKRKIMIPSAYKALHGDTRFNHYCENRDENYRHTWCVQTIKSIIENMVYMGDMENGKVEVISYKTKERKKVPKSKRIIVKDAHEAIISRDDFERVQVLIKARQRPHKIYNNDNNVFRGLIFCGECGHRMTFSAKNIPAGRKRYMRCQVHYVRPDFCSKPHNVPFQELYEIVAKRLKEMFSKLIDENELVSTIGKHNSSAQKLDKLKAELTQIEKRQSALTGLVVKLFESHSAGLMDTSNYQHILEKYQNEQKSLSKMTMQYNNEIQSFSEVALNVQKLKDVAEEFLHCEELTKEMLNRLIERIVVGHKYEMDGETRQDIEIVYRFINTNIV